MNYEFNLEDWLPRFPLEELHGHYSGGDITSPCDICNIEWLRRGMVDQYDWGRPVPVDVFVMSKGEPENRHATKIGGLPALPWECMTIAPCFGNRCRMNSYPEAVRTTDSKYPQCNGKDVWSPYCIPQVQATQIGRAPYFIQEGDDSLPGQPLCTIASVQPDMHQPYPWVNVPEPKCPEGKWDYGGDELMIGDLGCIYIFIDADGTLHAGKSCY